MKYSRTRKVLSVLSMMAMAASVALASSAMAAARYAPGEVIIKYKSGQVRTHAMMTNMLKAAGVASVRHLIQGMDRLILRENIKVEDAMADLMKNDSVEYVQPNYILYAFPDMNKLSNPPIPGLPGGGSGGGMPCIPGMDVPGCDPKACLAPGIPYPPGCHDSGGGSPAPAPGPAPDPGTPSQPSTGRPVLSPIPADVNPPVADPELSKTYGMNKIQADQAWAITRGSKDFLVADIDTGIDYNHEDLAFNVWRNPNPTQNDVVGFDFVHNDGLPFDDNEHGTHTAGTIGAVGGNGKGVSGVSQRVSIMAIKFLSGEGSGTTADAVKAIDYAVTHGAKVLSNSWGGPGDDGNQALADSIERARAKNVLFIAAAGNGDQFGNGENNDTSPNKSYPASFTNDNIISVAATDENDQITPFSNFGKVSVHLAAPGLNVYSTVPGNQYKAESGTSMACPHVAGAAALVWSKHPDWDYKKVKQVLMQTVDLLPGLTAKTVSGGRLNVLKALQAN